MEALVIFVIFFFFQEKEKEKQSLRDFFFLFLLLSRFSWLWDDYLLYIRDVGLSSFFIVLYIAEMGVVGGLRMYEADKDGYIWTAGVINPTQISMGYGQREREREKTHTITEDTALNLRLNPFIFFLFFHFFILYNAAVDGVVYMLLRYNNRKRATNVENDQTSWKWAPAKASRRDTFFSRCPRRRDRTDRPTKRPGWEQFRI